jgi:hypothetical protein
MARNVAVKTPTTKVKATEKSGLVIFALEEEETGMRWPDGSSHNKPPARQ